MVSAGSIALVNPVNLRMAVFATSVLLAAAAAFAQTPSVEPFLGKPRPAPGALAPSALPEVDEPPVVPPKIANFPPSASPPETLPAPEALEFPIVGLKTPILAPVSSPIEPEPAETQVVRLRALILPAPPTPANPSAGLLTPVQFQEPLPTLPAPREKTPANDPTPKGKKGAPDGDDALIGISIGEPTRELLFRMDTEKELRERLKRENEHWRDLKTDEFKSPVPKAFRAERGWKFHGARVEPNGVAYGRLWFEQTGPERYGQDFGPASTLFEIAWFNWDLALWPVRVVTPPWQCVETSVGRALPGDPQPPWDRGFPYRTWRELP